MPHIARKALLKWYRAMIARKDSIIGAGGGTGLSAECEEDLMIIYNAGRCRPAAVRWQAFSPTAILEAVPGSHGFQGASSMEHLPVETVLAEKSRAFKRAAF